MVAGNVKHIWTSMKKALMAVTPTQCGDARGACAPSQIARVDRWPLTFVHRHATVVTLDDLICVLAVVPQTHAADQDVLHPLGAPGLGQLQRGILPETREGGGGETASKPVNHVAPRPPRVTPDLLTARWAPGFG